MKIIIIIILAICHGRLRAPRQRGSPGCTINGIPCTPGDHVKRYRMKTPAAFRLRMAPPGAGERSTAALSGTALAAAALSVALLAGACSSSALSSAQGPGGTIIAVGAENEYANVIQQIGGRYVHASAIMSNPNTDPHTFEASSSVAQKVSAAQLIVQNGVGYDTWAKTIENAAANPKRKVINVQKLLGLPDSTPNPHLWYKPETMPIVADAIASDLAALDPSHAGYFRANTRSFITSLEAWNKAMAAFKSAHQRVPVAATEPVADYMLQAAGADNLTPWAFQADVMNGSDPSPQNVAAEKSLFTQHKVRAFLYNQQVTDSLTQSLIGLAKANGIPVVGVYETMPTPGYDYQSWMLAEVQDLQKAITDKTSTEKL
jgi:zinc/manganese transport system substrate-binding protein